MSFSAHPTYKASGVEWLGEVPTHWSVHRISELYREVAEPGHDELPILSVSIHDGVSDDEAEPDDEGRKVNRSDDRSKYKQVRPNDLVYNMMRAWQGGFGSVKVLGMVSPAYVVARPRNDAPSVLVELMLRTAGAIEEMRRRSKGVTDFRLRLYWDEFKDMRIALPPAREQLDILNFLSRETAKIDTLVGEQRRLIALLKEKRQAVISHAVTKGLNPDAPMKDSGVEWLGEVPAHWERVQLGRLCRQVSDGPHFSPTYVDSGVMFLSARNIRVDGWSLDDAKYVSEEDYTEFCRRVIPEIGDILYTKGGTTGIARVVDLQIRFQVWVHVAVLKLHRHLSDPHFVAYALNSSGCYEQSQLHTRGATNQDLGLTRLTKVWLVLPPDNEQLEIIEYLHKRTADIDALVGEANAVVDLLNERRAALISAAVTGKIDMRGSAEILRFPISRTRARGLIATEIIERSAHQATFGRVKLQKIAYLAEAHAGVTELEGAYLREAAGPLDRNMIREMELEAGALAGVRIEQPGGASSAVTYRLGDRHGAHRQDLAALLGDRAAKFDKLVADIGTIETKGAEAVATLYAVWNDALIDGETPADMEIKLAVLSEWHPEKAEKFTINELQIWLDWMRRHGLVPNGAGPKTTTGRLFA